MGPSDEWIKIGVVGYYWIKHETFQSLTNIATNIFLFTFIYMYIVTLIQNSENSDQIVNMHTCSSLSGISTRIGI
jgi:hypothetical protein